METGCASEDQNFWMASASWIDPMPSHSGYQTHLKCARLSGVPEWGRRYQTYNFHVRPSTSYLEIGRSIGEDRTNSAHRPFGFHHPRRMYWKRRASSSFGSGISRVDLNRGLISMVGKKAIGAR
jgi:hypothetical protein